MPSKIFDVSSRYATHVRITHTCMRTQACLHAGRNTNMHTGRWKCRHTHANTHIYTRVLACTHTHTGTDTQITHTDVHQCTHTRIQTHPHRQTSPHLCRHTVRHKHSHKHTHTHAHKSTGDGQNTPHTYKLAESHRWPHPDMDSDVNMSGCTSMEDCIPTGMYIHKLA